METIQTKKERSYWKQTPIKHKTHVASSHLKEEERQVIRYIVSELKITFTQFTRLMTLHYLNCDNHDPAMYEIIRDAKLIFDTDTE